MRLLEEWRGPELSGLRPLARAVDSGLVPRVGESAWAIDEAEPLGAGERARLRPFVGDLPDVVLHRGSAAARSAAHLGADAFTVDRDVFFGSGAFAPDTPSGAALLAHELTHVAQQSRGDPTAPASERQAEAAEWAVRAAAAGRPPGLTVGTHHRGYASTAPGGLAAGERASLDRAAIRAIAIAEQRLTTELGAGPPRVIERLAVDLTLAIGDLSVEAAAEQWGEAIAAAVRERLSAE
jgi:hypothetical protein